MTTTMVDSWAVDLANVGPIYPFVGTEVILFVLGLVFWLFWHLWQLKFEKETYDDDMKKLGDPENVEKAMREHRID